MQINSIQSYTNYSKINPRPNFKAGGKPITLKYVLEKRANLLPERVFKEAKKILSSSRDNIPSLMELHKNIYLPLLSCKSLEEAQNLFPEFSKMLPEVKFERNTRYAQEFKARTDKNFVLKMLQEYWGNLKTKDNIAQEMGMKSRSSLDWALNQIGFVTYPSNYKTLLLASDKECNSVIAAKTRAWNILHPDLMYAKNKHAAQSCKKQEYREAQSKRIKDYDKEHPERREKISLTLREAWGNCPEIKAAMSDLVKKSPQFIKKVIMKHINGQSLTPMEERINRGFYKHFWDTYPELKATFSKAISQVHKK